MKILKSLLVAATAVVVGAGCLAFSACNNGEQVTAEQWKAAFENSRNSESYSYECVCIQQTYELEKDYRIGKPIGNPINLNMEYKIDKVNDVYYCEFTDGGSVLPEGNRDGIMFGKYYVSGEDIYYSSENADGSFGEWSKRDDMTNFKQIADVFNEALSDRYLIYLVERENGERVKLPLTELYDYFTFDKKSCCYCATLQVNAEIEQDVRLSFRSGKIYSLECTTKPVGDNALSRDTGNDVSDDDSETTTETYTLSSYKFTFYGYNDTVVLLPEELKNL